MGPVAFLSVGAAVATRGAAVAKRARDAGVVERSPHDDSVFEGDAQVVFRLVSAFAGQGSAERQHKVVKTLRTKQRNRMSAKVTEALQLIRSTQRMEEARLAGKTTMPCLKAIRLQIAEVIEEAEEEEEEANDGGGGGGGGGGANGGVEGEAIAANPPPPAWNYVLEYIRAGRANDGDREGLNDLFDNEENVEDAEAALEGNGAAAAVAAAAAAGSGSGV